MVRLDRGALAAPKTWKGKVDKRLRNAKLFWRKAAEFEKLALARRKSMAFKAHAKRALHPPKYDFPAVWRSSKALKKKLAAMSDGYCAYCQASVSDAYSGAIEHFRPKALFPMLAYEWDNYFYSCERCNTFKSDKWPARGAYVRPDHGDPAARFVFQANGSVKAAPRDAAARNTIRDLRLDRAPLSSKRSQAIQAILGALETMLRMPGLTDAQRHELAKSQMAKKLSRFSEAINQNVRRVWGQAFPKLVI